MIRPLRQRHLRLAVLLALAVPILLAFALVARRPFPTAAIPAPLLEPAPAGTPGTAAP